MERLDDGQAVNPFRRPCSGLPLADDLLMAEATEIAHGYRHLTVTHGDPSTVAESRVLDAFYDTIRHLARDLSWARVRGDDSSVTITVRGADASRRIALFAAAADLANPGAWAIEWTAVPTTR